MKAAAAIALFLALILAAPAGAHTSRTDSLKKREQRQLRTLVSSHSTLRFFERHARILYGGPLARRRAAWRVVRFHRARIGWTIRELGETRASLRVLLRPAIPHRAQWLCIFSHENGGYGWTAQTGNGYYGGLQMDLSFQRAHGSEFLRHYGTADRWPPETQMLVAERAYRTRGFSPWPNTARMCGLL